MIYLDYNAITCGFEDILNDAFNVSKKYKFFNPSSVHQAGIDAKNIVLQSRHEISKALNARCHDIYFVSGATEGNNMVLNYRKFDAIFTTATEHDSILACLKNKPYHFVKVDENGLIDLEDLEYKIKTVNSKNFLCSIMFANNESGVLQNIKEISELVKKYKGIMHSDCSQVFGKINFDFSDFDCLDVITFSGNKIHAGLGGGCVVCVSGFELEPLIFGGGQQNYKRGGTENVLQIFALSKALSRVISKDYMLSYQNKVNQFSNLITKTVFNNNGEIFAFNVSKLPNTFLIKMNNLVNYIQMMEFDLNNICVSIGSACSSGRTEVSHVLKACNIQEEEAKKYIRVSTGFFNTLEDIEKFCFVWEELSKR
jgi:cysteine desulfurase